VSPSIPLRSTATSAGHGAARQAARRERPVRRHSHPVHQECDLRALAIMKDSPNRRSPMSVHYKLNPKFTDAMKASGFFYGVFVKKGTPPEITAKLTAAYKSALAEPSSSTTRRTTGCRCWASRHAGEGLHEHLALADVLADLRRGRCQGIPGEVQDPEAGGSK